MRYPFRAVGLTENAGQDNYERRVWNASIESIKCGEKLRQLKHIFAIWNKSALILSAFENRLRAGLV